MTTEYSHDTCAAYMCMKHGDLQKYYNPFMHAKKITHLSSA